jgi:hypothetical protein
MPTKVAHKIPGRIRLRLDSIPDPKQKQALIEDLKTSPGVAKVDLRGSSLIIEHVDDDDTSTALGKALNKVFPGFEPWSDSFDAKVAKFGADPWMNKLIPLAFLGVAAYTGITTGAVLAGESAFALGYVAFDLYWKFQQENVVRKIEQGLSQSEKSNVE